MVKDPCIWLGVKGTGVRGRVRGHETIHALQGKPGPAEWYVPTPSAPAYELLNAAFQDSVLQLEAFPGQRQTDCPTAVKRVVQQPYALRRRCAP